MKCCKKCLYYGQNVFGHRTDVTCYSDVGPYAGEEMAEYECCHCWSNVNECEECENEEDVN